MVMSGPLEAQVQVLGWEAQVTEAMAMVAGAVVVLGMAMEAMG
jgi:hypothetical protein